MSQWTLVVIHDTRSLNSVLDIEGVAKSLVERGSLNDAQLAHHLVVLQYGRINEQTQLIARNTKARCAWFWRLKDAELGSPRTR